MPTYTLEDTETGEQHDVLMTWDDLQEYKKGNPNLKQVITGGPAIVGGVGNRTGLGQSGGFNEMLSKVADAHPNGLRPFRRANYIEKFKNFPNGQKSAAFYSSPYY